MNPLSYRRLRQILFVVMLILASQTRVYSQHTTLHIYGEVSSNSKTPIAEYSTHSLQMLSMKNMQKGKPLPIHLEYKDEIPLKMQYKKVLEHAAKIWSSNLVVSEQIEGPLNIKVVFNKRIPENIAYIASPFCKNREGILFPNAVLFAAGDITRAQLPEGQVGIIQINSNLNWFIEGSIHETITAQQYDLKTIMLRAIGNILGFASSVGASSSLKPQKIVQATILDKFILDLNGKTLFDQVNGKRKNQLSAVVGKDFFWKGNKTLPLYNPSEITTESFMCFSEEVPGLFSGKIMKGQTEHYIDPNTLQVMWGVGWKRYGDNKVKIETKGKNEGDILAHGATCSFRYVTSSSLPISPIKWSVHYLGKDSKFHNLFQGTSQELTIPIQFDTNNAYANSAGLYMIQVRIEGVSQGMEVSGDKNFFVSAAPGPIKVSFTETIKNSNFVSGIVSIESAGAEDFQVSIIDYADGHKVEGNIKHLNYTSFRIHALNAVDGYAVVKVKATNKAGYQEVEVPILESIFESDDNTKEKRIELAGCIADEAGCLMDILISPFGDWYDHTVKSVQMGQDYIYDGKIIETFLDEEEPVSTTSLYDVPLIHKLCPGNAFDDIYVTLHLRKEDGSVVSSDPYSIRKAGMINSLSSPTEESRGFDITSSSPSSIHITFHNSESHTIRLYNLSGELLFSEAQVQGEIKINLPTTRGTAHYILQIDSNTMKI